MASDDLFFLRTGDETSAFVLVRLLGGDGTPQAEASLEKADAPDDAAISGLRGDLPMVLREANEFALLKGYDFRVDLAGHDWPAELGIIGNR